ncbi:hypothetical protein Tco_0115703 [Tanacetum coccineum]
MTKTKKSTLVQTIIQLTKEKGLPSTDDEDIHKSSPLFEAKTTDHQDIEGNKQPVVKGLPSTHPDEGTRKTNPLPKGNNIDPKDLGRNIQLTNWGQPSTLVTDQSGSGIKDQRSMRLEKKWIHKDHPASSKDKKIDNFLDASNSESSSCSKTFKPFDNYMPVIERMLEDHARNKKVLEVAEAYIKNSTNLTELLTLVKNFDFPSFKTNVEYLQAAMTAQNDHLAKWTESSASMSWSITPMMTKIENTQAKIHLSLLPQATCIPTTVGGEFNIHCNYKPFVPSLEPSRHEGDQVDMNVKPAQTVIPPTQYPKTPITPEGRVIKLSRKPLTEEKDIKGVEVTIEPVQEPQDTKSIPITIVMPIPKSAPEDKHVGSSSSRPKLTDTVIDITPLEEQPTNDPSHITPKDNRGKGIARDPNESPIKFVPTSKDVRPDPNTLVLIPYEIKGKMYQLTNEQIQAHWKKKNDDIK